MELKPGYKQTKVGVIPEDWDVRPIRGEIDLLTGFPFPSSGYSKFGIRLLRGSNVKRGMTDWDDEITQYWPQITYEISQLELQDGDLVIAMDGSLVGRSFARLTNHDLPSLLLQRVARIRSTKIDVGFLTAIVGSERFVEYSDSVKTVTAIPHISPSDIRNFEIPIPPTLNEQRAIAAALSDVDDLIAALDRQIAKKRDIKQATMQQLLIGKTRLPGFSGEWGDELLGALGSFSKGKGITRDQVQTDGLPCVRYGEIYTHHRDHVRQFYSFISPDVAKTSQRIKKGELLFTGSGETAEEIGKCVAYLGEEEAYAGGDIVILSPDRGDPKFLGYLMNHSSVVEQKTRMGQGDAVVHISATNLSKVQVTLPEEDEQEAIASVLWNMDAEIIAFETQQEKSLWLKQGMMQELLTGKIRLV